MNQTILRGLRDAVAMEFARFGVLVHIDAWTEDEGHASAPALVVYGVPDEQLVEGHDRLMDVLAETLGYDQRWPLFAVRTLSECRPGGACYASYQRALQSGTAMWAQHFEVTPLAWVTAENPVAASVPASTRSHSSWLDPVAVPGNPDRVSPPAEPENHSQQGMAA